MPTKEHATQIQDTQLLKAAKENDFATAKELITHYTGFSIAMEILRSLKTDTAEWLRIVLKEVVSTIVCLDVM